MVVVIAASECSLGNGMLGMRGTQSGLVMKIPLQPVWNQWEALLKDGFGFSAALIVHHIQVISKTNFYMAKNAKAKF